jgi:hypothetical protein
MEDWTSEIAKGWRIHERIQELDRAGLWEHFLPDVAASEDEIAATEQQLGFRLDPEYRQFLRFANGWRRFYQDVDLFGTRNLLGAPPMDSAMAQLNAMDPADLEREAGMGAGDVLPIAASAEQRDMFLLGQPWSSAPGAVVWLSGQAVDRFPGFDEFYLAMLDYNREEIQDLERGG